MGKKRSKTSKQKQAKARQTSPSKKISSHLGGVKISKGHSSKFQQSKTAALVVSSSASTNNTHKKNQWKNNTPSKNNNNHKTKTTRKVFLSPPPTIAKTTSVDDEEKEYQRQLASMRERQLAKEFKTKEQKSHNKSFLELQPASFSTEKSTNDLLQETVSKMQSMEGVGESPSIATPIRTNQSWSVVKEPPAFANNPFEALAENDDDDDSDHSSNEWNPKKKQASLVQLAPASFSLLPRITPTPATTPCRFDGEEIDPDL